MSKIEVNEIDKTTGSTLTLGGSGTAVTLACGATQTGFGREGSVNWQTAIKTSTFTAASGEGYFVDTSSGGVTVNLPAGSVGAIVSIKDYAQTFDTGNCTISANGSEKIEGLTTDLILSTEGLAVTLVYGDATKGWQAVNSNEITNVVTFISATGGSVATVCTNFKVHTFTGPGTFCVSCAGSTGGSNTVDYLVVAGGGGSNACKGGGAGAGGFRESSGAASGCYTASPLGGGVSALPVSVQGYPITVGAGGTGTLTPGTQTSGSNSIFSTITSTGGGKGASGSAPRPGNATGGSGGGGARNTTNAGAAGNTPPVTPSQGNNGGNNVPPSCGGGGGGGATAVGGNSSGCDQAGNGGAGATTSITNTPTAYAGGGGGGAGSVPFRGSGGTGGGGRGGAGPGDAAVSGTANTGGGGGGGPNFGASGSGGSGGSGIVIIRYKFQ
jgi:hypothetical protein